MCGVFASIGIEPDPARLDLVAHRGPDGRGWHVAMSPAGPVALGHRRLAIIDLSDAGAQPMADPSGRHWLTFNGEIYNYREVRVELEALGHTFRSSSDTEVLLRALIEWDIGALDRLAGMFAFVYWDDKAKRLLAVRDRFGIKPLYYCLVRKRGEAGFAFASEIKQLIGLEGDATNMNRARVRDFLLSGISDHTNETLFDNILQLRGGEYAEVTHDSRGAPRIAISRWYAYPTSEPLDISRPEAGEQFAALFQQSIDQHLRSDVPVGSCLSGGLDSSSIVCLMAKKPDRMDIHTISACFEEKAVDERPFMDAVIAHTGVATHRVYPKANDLFDLAEKITWYQDEPFASTSIFAQWCVFDRAGDLGLKVMMDGQGADEPLAGYHSSFFYYLRELYHAGKWMSLAKTMVSRRRLHGQTFHAMLSLLPVTGRLQQAMNWVGKTAPVSPARDWLGSPAFATLPPVGSVFDEACHRLGLPPASDVSSFCYAMTFAVNLHMLLHYEDRNSMAHSIEARVPFLDHRLVEFVLRLGAEHKFDGAATKAVMRRGLRDTLPKKILNRHDKLGFATPEEIWFRGKLKERVYAGVRDTLDYYPQLLNSGEVELLAADYLEGRRPFDYTMWRIANLGIWGRKMGVGLN